MLTYHVFKKFVILFFIFLFGLSIPGYSERLGVLLQTQSGDNYYKNALASGGIYYISDPLPVLLNQTGYFETNINTRYQIGFTVGIRQKWFSYASSRYFWMLGVVGQVDTSHYDSTFSNPETVVRPFLRGYLEEEITSGLFLNAGIQLNMPSKYQQSLVQPELYVGMTYFFDSKPYRDDIIKLPQINYDQILKENMVVKKGDHVQADILTKIKQFTDIKNSVAIDIPKFVKRGVPFIISKEFLEEVSVKQMTAKIQNTSVPVFYFYKQDVKTWACKVVVPADFKEDQVKISISIMMTNGVHYEEIVTTLIE